MKKLRIPAVFGSSFPFSQDLANHCFLRILKKNSSRVPIFGCFLRWRGLFENSTRRILGLSQENIKSQKIIHKLSSSCFEFKLFSNLKFQNSRARASTKYAVDNLKRKTLVESGHVRLKIVPRVSFVGTRLARYHPSYYPECWSGRSRTQDLRHGMRSAMLNQLNHRFENSSRPFTTPTLPRSFQFASRNTLEILIVRSGSCVPHSSFWLLTNITTTGPDE